MLIYYVGPLKMHKKCECRLCSVTTKKPHFRCTAFLTGFPQTLQQSASGFSENTYSQQVVVSSQKIENDSLLLTVATSLGTPELRDVPVVVAVCAANPVHLVRTRARRRARAANQLPVTVHAGISRRRGRHRCRRRCRGECRSGARNTVRVARVERGIIGVVPPDVGRPVPRIPVGSLSIDTENYRCIRNAKQ